MFISKKKFHEIICDTERKIEEEIRAQVRQEDEARWQREAIDASFRDLRREINNMWLHIRCLENKVKVTENDLDFEAIKNNETINDHTVRC